MRLPELVSEELWQRAGRLASQTFPSAPIQSAPQEAAFPAADGSVENQPSRGDCPLPKDNPHSLDISTLAIFPEYVEFDGDDVLKLVVPGKAGRTIR